MISNRGFSLVEILISIIVVVLAGMGTFKLYSYLEVEKANAAMYLDAKRLAESQIALTQTLNTNGSACEGKTIENIQSCVMTLDESAMYEVFVTPTKTLQHTPASGVAATYAKIMDVKVTWTDRNGKPQSLTLPVTVSNFTNLLE